MGVQTTGNLIDRLKRGDTRSKQYFIDLIESLTTDNAFIDLPKGEAINARDPLCIAYPGTSLEAGKVYKYDRSDPERTGFVGFAGSVVISDSIIRVFRKTIGGFTGLTKGAEVFGGPNRTTIQVHPQDDPAFEEDLPLLYLSLGKATSTTSIAINESFDAHAEWIEADDELEQIDYEIYLCDEAVGNNLNTAIIDGKAVVYNPANEDHYYFWGGISMHAAGVNQAVKLKDKGIMTIDANNLIIGEAYFCGPAGSLVTVPETPGIWQPVGIAIATNKLKVFRGTPVIRR